MKTQTPVKIRKAQPQDNILLAEIGARMFTDTFASDNSAEDMAAYLAKSFSPEKQAAELAEPGTIFLLAELEDKTVGYARLKTGSIPDCIHGQKPLELVRLYASKEWIGRGIGAALMEACIQQAISDGHDVLWLDVWERNTSAIAFYSRWGFRVVGEQNFELGNEIQNDLVMEKPFTTQILPDQDDIQ